MIRIIRYRVGVAIAALMVLGVLAGGTTPLEEELRVGIVTIPQDVQLGDVRLARGQYLIQLVPKEEGVFFQFFRREELIAEDLAIVQPAPTTRRRPWVGVEKLWNQEFIRIMVHFQDKYYKIFLPPAETGR